MPTITLKDGQTFEVSAGKRLVLAIEDAGVDILHRCGGYARCTTCRVTFEAGEPDRMTQAELDKLRDANLFDDGIRLSCQILCDHDMTVEPLNTRTSTGLDDSGPRPEDHITPEPEWVTKPAE